LDYQNRVKILQQSGIALWDVLKHCERKGSLDADIIASSEIPNDIPGLLNEYPDICVIAFNGKKAGKTFHKYILPVLPSQEFIWLSLPSTSPANASIPKTEKLKNWMKIKKYL
jgi:hypoxanthine-DNA glycosylase